MLKHTPKYLVSKAAILPTKHGGSKKRWQLKKHWINHWKLHSTARNGELPPFFILFPGLFEIIAQSAHGTAILVFGMYVEVFRKRGLWLVTTKVLNELISQIYQCWGWVPVLGMNVSVKFLLPGIVRILEPTHIVYSYTTPVSIKLQMRKIIGIT